MDLNEVGSNANGHGHLGTFAATLENVHFIDSLLQWYDGPKELDPLNRHSK